MKKLTGFLGLVLLASVAQLAQATTEVSYQVGGVAPPATGANSTITCASLAGDVASCTSISASGVTILQASASSTSPGSGGVAQQFGTTLQIDNTTGSTVDVYLFFASNGFTQPVTGGSVTGINWLASLSFTTTAGSGSISDTNCVDTSNGLTNPYCTTAADGLLVNPSIAYNAAAIPTSSGGESTNTAFTPLTGTYSLSQAITIVLGAGAFVNVNSSQVLTAVPEPTSIALLGGVILLISGAIRRKRKQEASRV